MICILKDKLEDQIKTEKSQLTELESQIRKVEREVLNLRKKDVPELQLCEKAIECARNMDLLENRLYVVRITPNVCIVFLSTFGFSNKIHLSI